MKLAMGPGVSIVLYNVLLPVVVAEIRMDNKTCMNLNPIVYETQKGYNSILKQIFIVV